MTKRQSDDNNGAFYERDSHSYDETRFADTVGGRETGRLREMLHRRLPPAGVRGALEVGCGTGRVTQILATITERLELVDVSAAMLARASAAATTANPELRLGTSEGSIFDLPFDSDRFDLVVSVNVLTHLRDYPAAIREMARTLAPGGRLIFSTTSVDSLYMPAGIYVNRRGEAVGQDVYSIWPRRSAVRRAIKDAGLELVATDAMFHIPRAVRKVPMAGSILTGADRLAQSTKAGSRVAPWVLWTTSKPSG